MAGLSLARDLPVPPRQAVADGRRQGVALRGAGRAPVDEPFEPMSKKEVEVLLEAQYPFLSIMWTLLVIFGWVIWFWLLISVFADLFRRDDVSGWAKAGWVVFVLVLPFLGVLVYLISQSTGIAERQQMRAQASKSQFDQYVRSVGAGSSPASQIETAQHLLDSGSITRDEFEEIKRRTIASA